MQISIEQSGLMRQYSVVLELPYFYELHIVTLGPGGLEL